MENNSCADAQWRIETGETTMEDEMNVSEKSFEKALDKMRELSKANKELEQDNKELVIALQNIVDITHEKNRASHRRFVEIREFAKHYIAKG